MSSAYSINASAIAPARIASTRRAKAVILNGRAAHERSRRQLRGQKLPFALVAAQAGSKAARAQAGGRSGAIAGGGCRTSSRAGVRSLEPAEAGRADGNHRHHRLLAQR